MTVEEEMLKAKAAYAKQLAKLNRKKAAEEKKITDLMLVELKDEHSDFYNEMYERAFRKLTAQREERSRKAKAARQAKDAGTADLVEAEEEASEAAMSQY